MEMLLSKCCLVRKLVFKYHIPSGVSSAPGLHAHLILHYRMPSFGDMLKASYMEHVLQILMT